MGLMGRMGFAARLPTKPGVRADVNNQNLDTMDKFELLTNEWLSAKGNKWIGRKVLCHFNDGWEEPLIWNGYYWNDQKGHRVVETIEHRVTHFCIYEKFNENDIID